MVFAFKLRIDLRSGLVHTGQSRGSLNTQYHPNMARSFPVHLRHGKTEPVLHQSAQAWKIPEAGIIKSFQRVEVVLAVFVHGNDLQCCYLKYATFFSFSSRERSTILTATHSRQHIISTDRILMLMKCVLKRL